MSAIKLIELIAELNVKKVSPDLERYDRERYEDFIHAANVVLQQKFTEEQYVRQYEHIKRNLSTFEMCVKRWRTPDHFEEFFYEEDGYLIPEGEGQIILCFEDERG